MNVTNIFRLYILDQQRECELVISYTFLEQLSAIQFLKRSLHSEFDRSSSVEGRVDRCRSPILGWTGEAVAVMPRLCEKSK